MRTITAIFMPSKSGQTVQTSMSTFKGRALLDLDLISAVTGRDKDTVLSLIASELSRAEFGFTTSDPEFWVEAVGAGSRQAGYTRTPTGELAFCEAVIIEPKEGFLTSNGAEPHQVASALDDVRALKALLADRPFIVYTRLQEHPDVRAFPLFVLGALKSLR